MRPTSLESWASLQQYLPAARWEALAALIKHPGLTARELEKQVDSRHINKRLSELERDGLVAAKDKRPCSVSHRNALTWWPTSPRMPDRREKAPGWKERALKAEAEVIRLQRELSRRGQQLELAVSP
jgi:hypothetical protein